MAVNVVTIDPLADKRWDIFVTSHADSSLFHYASWHKVLQASFGYRPLYFVALDEDDAIRGCAAFAEIRSPLTGARLVSLPFSDYCEILTEDKASESAILEAVLRKSNELNASKIEIRSRGAGVNFESYGFVTKRTYLNHVLFTTEPAEILIKRVHTSYRYDLRKAKESGLAIISASTEVEFKKYYELYSKTRRYHGLPPMPYIFFENVWKLFFPKGMLVLLLAVDNGLIVAGLLLLKNEEGFYAISNSSNRDYLHKRPNHLLWWRGIEIACDSNLKYFDFGRTSLDNEGLLRFKRRWGSKEYTISHFTRFARARRKPSCFHRGLYPDLRRDLSLLAHEMCKKLPIGLLEMGSRFLYKHLG